MNNTQLPNGWTEAQLSVLNDYKTANLEPSHFSDEVFELFSVPVFPTKKPEYLSGKEIGSSKQIVAPNDILLCKINPRINRVWSVKQKSKYRQIASSEWIIIRQPLINIDFLRYQLSEKSFRDRLCADVAGVGGSLTRAQPKKVATYEIRIAPLAEQKEIASLLDNLLAQVDTLKTRLDAIPNILKRFRQSVLAAAVSGKLTEEWREKHSICVSDLRNTLHENRRKKWENAERRSIIASGRTLKDDKWKEKYKFPVPVIDDECFNIPSGWIWSNLMELSWSVKDGPHYSPKYEDSGVPFISGGNISTTGIDFSNTKYISKELHDELSKRCHPETGDMLYTKGGTTGIAYYNKEKRDFNVWVHVAVLKLVDVVDGTFLQHALNSKHCYEQSQKYTHGVGNQDLGLTRLIKITVPFPPIEEQEEIVRRVEELFAFADQIEQRVRVAQQRVNHLTQAILAKAFRGELTAEWREQNPDLISGENSAAALLARIQAEQKLKQVLAKPTRRQPKSLELDTTDFKFDREEANQR